MRQIPVRGVTAVVVLSLGLFCGAYSAAVDVPYTPPHDIRATGKTEFLRKQKKQDTSATVAVDIYYCPKRVVVLLSAQDGKYVYDLELPEGKRRVWRQGTIPFLDPLMTEFARLGTPFEVATASPFLGDIQLAHFVKMAPDSEKSAITGTSDTVTIVWTKQTINELQFEDRRLVRRSMGVSGMKVTETTNAAFDEATGLPCSISTVQFGPKGEPLVTGRTTIEAVSRHAEDADGLAKRLTAGMELLNPRQ